MTNEEAINVLNDYDINFERSTPKEVAEAHEMAIKALEAQPSEDWNAVLDELNRIGRNAFKDDTDYDNLFDFISNLPNVKPQPKAEGARGDIPLQQSVPKMPQPSNDCISRKAVLDALHRYFAEGFNEDRWWNSTHVLDAINKAPSVTPQPKTGHWVLSGGYWRCSECKEKALLKLDKATGGYREYEPVRSKYCPECGAKMEEMK